MIFNFSSDQVSRIIPDSVEKSTAGLTSSTADGFKSGLSGISSQIEALINNIGNFFKK
jgi:hypothetical protein